MELGCRYRDTLTGIEGVATARHEYLFGCVRYSLEYVKDGEVKAEVFDEQRLETIEADVVAARTAKSGGPQDTPLRPSSPPR